MDLRWLESRLMRRLDLAETQFSNYLQNMSMPPVQGQDLHILEGWLSDIWQLWGRFCRRVVVESCNGCIGPNGAAIANTHASEAHVSFIASRQSNGIPPNSIGINTALHREPTWGHIDKLLNVIQALSPANASVLSAAFGTVPELEHLRLIRNAAAHLHSQNFAAVTAFQALYISTPIRHPLQALLWIDKTSGKTLVQSRIDDMRVAAKNSCL